MALRRQDFFFFLNGLKQLASAAVEANNKQLHKVWLNSSLNPVAKRAILKLQENLSYGQFKQVDLSKKASEAVEKLSVLKEGLKACAAVDFREKTEFEEMTGENNKDSDATFSSSGKFAPKEIRSVNLDEQLIAINAKLEELQGESLNSDMKLIKETPDLKSWSLSHDEKEKFEAHNESVLSELHISETKRVTAMSDVASADKKPLAKTKAKSTLSLEAQARKVPHSRFSRLLSFGGLATGLGMGAVAEVVRRTVGIGKEEGGPSLLDSSPFLTESNAQRIVDTLCKVRGDDGYFTSSILWHSGTIDATESQFLLKAVDILVSDYLHRPQVNQDAIISDATSTLGAALKLGQMLSIQDSAVINPVVQKIFERVRQSADFMPTWQLQRTLLQDFGPDWRNMVASFDERPFAAASIGQVHEALLHDGRAVAMKIQYPGVAQGIDSDIDNLISTLNIANILPEGMFIDSLIDVAKRELKYECDYAREKSCAMKYHNLIAPFLQYYVPEIIEELCTKQVFTTELIEGLPIDKCVDLDQKTRNYISSLILRLCLMELFQFGFMQTDPNWSNFLYNADTRQLVLLDFGACRAYDKAFVDKYINVIHGAATRDREKVAEYSKQLGFLTGYESKVMVKAHVDAVMILGEAFQEERKFSFGNQNTTRRIQQLIPVMLSHRMCPPPEESYSLHRKMSGVFLLCAKLQASIHCKSFFDDLFDNYKPGGSWDDARLHKVH